MGQIFLKISIDSEGFVSLKGWIQVWFYARLSSVHSNPRPDIWVEERCL